MNKNERDEIRTYLKKVFGRVPNKKERDEIMAECKSRYNKILNDYCTRLKDYQGSDPEDVELKIMRDSLAQAPTVSGNGLWYTVASTRDEATKTQMPINFPLFVRHFFPNGVDTRTLAYALHTNPLADDWDIYAYAVMILRLAWQPDDCADPSLDDEFDGVASRLTRLEAFGR